MSVSEKVNKSHIFHVLKITQYKKCTVWKYIYAQWPYHKLVANQKNKIPINNEKGHGDIIHHNNINWNSSCAV